MYYTNMTFYQKKEYRKEIYNVSEDDYGEKMNDIDKVKYIKKLHAIGTDFCDMSKTEQIRYEDQLQIIAEADYKIKLEASTEFNESNK